MHEQISETRYCGERLRYYVFDRNKLLFNTQDLYELLSIREPVGETESDLASAILLATSRDADFAMWLTEKFSNYSDETLLRPSDLVWD